MKGEAVQIAFDVMALVFAGAAETLLPKVLGTGCPCLLAAAVWTAWRRRVPSAALFAVAAGVFEDALSGLPPATSASFFLGAALLAKWPPVPRTAFLAAFPLYQLWLWIWVADLNGGLFARLLLALPFGAATGVAACALLAWTGRRAALDEA